MSKWHLVQQQLLLREILKEPIISYRKKCSLRHTRERKMITRARKPNIPWSFVQTFVANTENTGRTTESFKPVNLNLHGSSNQARF